jgi:phosphatidylserine decarboxylase
MSELKSRLFLLLQKILPRFALTAIVFRLARIRTTGVKNFLIRQFVNFYNVDVEEVQKSVPDEFATFNDFFIRELVTGARQVDATSTSIVSPADGTVSAAGKIESGRIFQAKGLHYTLTDLLATDIDDAKNFVDGAFATIYLSPSDYHRVHSPLAGELVAARYVPGDLFSVNEATVSCLPNLFVRNERLICHIEMDSGPAVVILVGALNVGSISTRWSGDLRPRKKGVVDNIDIAQKGVATRLEKGDLIGWFNMGSTVIVLLPPGSSAEFSNLDAGARVKMGQAIGSISQA